jgi:arylsulfatase A-like enzyme
VGAPSFAFENRAELRTYSGIPPASEPMGDSLARNLKRGYYASTTFIDAQVGRVLAALDAAGVGDNTLVVLFGDHGFHLGEQNDWAKHTNFDVGTRVPLIIRAPGAPGNQATAAIAELVDLYPTVVELAGLPRPTAADRGGYAMEGDSLAQFIDTPSAVSRRGAFSQWRRNGWDGYSLRTDRYRFTEWVNGSSRQLELYDHAVDPDETTNVAARPEYADAIEALRDALAAGGQADLPVELR